MYHFVMYKIESGCLLIYNCTVAFLCTMGLYSRYGCLMALLFVPICHSSKPRSAIILVHALKNVHSFNSSIT